MDTSILSTLSMIAPDLMEEMELRTLILLLSPVAPHICEEMWENMGFAAETGKMACQMPWPVYDESKTIASEVEMAVQIQGKLRGSVKVPMDSDEATVVAAAKAVDKVARQLIEEAGSDMTYHVGTMIEIPRAALTADDIAKEAEFFSFGTNDLTQMTFGFSRDDAGKFLASYYDRKIYEADPFSKLDQVGVGRLVKMACELGRQTRPDIKLGICGEQGGDPSTVEFCHNVGLTYVSCSPFRVPIARLAAAQAAIKNPRK